MLTRKNSLAREERLKKTLSKTYKDLYFEECEKTMKLENQIFR